MEPVTPSTDKKIPLLDLDELHRPLMDDINRVCREVIASGAFILGPNVGELEKEIAAYCGVEHAVGVASGSDAIHLCLRALGIGPGDEVITTPFTFCATADSIMLAGARPVFADIDPLTFNIDPESVAAAITPATRAIMPVHLYGLPADMDALKALAEKHDLFLVEDNAQALGATLGGVKTGALGDLAAVSFFPSKNLGCCGDGGMVLTDSGESADRVRSLRAHGTSRKYYSTELGLNSRLDALQAAILRIKLPHLNSWNDSRRDNASRYNELLGGHESIVTPDTYADASHVFHQYTIRIPDRDRVQKSLKDAGIATAVYYPTPLHLQPLFGDLGSGAGDLPNAESAAGEVLSLPVGPELAEEDIVTVSDTVIRCLGRK